MSNKTTFTEHSTPIVAAWLNDVDTTTFVALADGSNNPPVTAAQVITNIGALTTAVAATIYAPIASPTFTGAVRLPAGAVATPSIYLSTDTSSGLYRIGANNIGVAVSGVKVVDVASTGVTVEGGLFSTLGSNLATTSGTVGIGTTTPTSTLQVVQSTTGAGTVSNAAAGTTVTGVGTTFTNTFQVNDTITIGGETVAISAIASNTSMTTAAIVNANTTSAYTLVGGTRLAVTGYGNVGIGTTTPAYKLDVSGTLRATTVTASEQISADGGLQVAGIITERQNEGVHFYVAHNSTTPLVDFWGGSGARLSIDTSVRSIHPTISGDFAVGTAALPMGTSHFTNITFPATQVASTDANTLDDYEEGTWTPAIDGATTGTATYTAQVGSYTKIGDKVHCQGQIHVSALGTIAGSVFIKGLPFTSQGTAGNFSAGQIGFGAGLSLPAAGQNIVIHTAVSSNVSSLNLWDSIAGTTDLQASEFSASGRILFNIEYKTAT